MRSRIPTDRGEASVGEPTERGIVSASPEAGGRAAGPASAKWRRWIKPLLYLWASPVTVPAMVLALLARCQGGEAAVVDGVIEAHGGLVTRLLERGTPWVRPISAITLGHVVLGRDGSCLRRTRAHERVHVRQYERWGPAFIPAYVLASVAAGLRGCDPYRDNPFERQAFDQAPTR